MNEGFGAALHTAWSLVIGFDARLAQVVGLSLGVSGTACLLSAGFGMAAGAWLAVARLTCRMVQEHHVKKVPYTVYETVIEKQIKKVPYQVCRMVPHTVVKKVPYQECVMEKYTVCCKVPYTECVKQAYTCKVPYTVCETVPCTVTKQVKVCVPETVCVKKARLIPVTVPCRSRQSSPSGTLIPAPTP